MPDGGLTRRHFAGKWIQSALRGTFVSSRRASIWTSLTVLILGSLLNGYRLAHPSHHKKAVHVSLWSAIWPSLAGAAVVLVIFFVYHFFATPHRITAQLVREHQTALESNDRESRALLEEALREQQEKRLAEMTAHGRTQDQLVLEQESHEATKAELELQKRAAISPDHLEQIKRIARNVHTCIDQGLSCDFRDPTSQLTDWRFHQALEVHCPAVVAECDRWDEAIADITNGLSELSLMVHQQVTSSFQDPWRTDGLEPAISDYLRRLAQQPPNSGVVIRRLERGLPGTEDYIYSGTWAVYQRKALTDEDIAAAQMAVDMFLPTVAETPQFGFLKTAYALRRQRKQPAAVAVLRVLDQQSLPRNGGCPLC